MISVDWTKVFNIFVTVAVCAVLIFLVRLLFVKFQKKNNGINIKFFKSFITVVIVLVGLYNCLLFFDTTKEISKSLFTGSALILAVVTFAAQKALGNVISGIFISTTKPYDITDKIKVLNGSTIIAEGIVDDISIRHTIIRTFDGQSTIVPNSIMDDSVIINTNFTENVGNFLEVEVGFDADVEKAIGIIKDIINDNSRVIFKEKVDVKVSAFTDNGVKLKTIIWTKNIDDNFIACSDIRKAVLKQFRENNITIPYQTITIEK